MINGLFFIGNVFVVETKTFFNFVVFNKKS